MNRVRVSTLAFSVLLATSSSAQAGSETQEQPRQGDSQEKGNAENLRAASTRWGDTGFFDVFSAYTIRKHKVAAGGFRDSIDREVFDMDISNLGATFTMGLTDRIELFGRFDLQRNILARDPPFFGIQQAILEGIPDACLDPEVARKVNPLLFLEICGINPNFVANPAFFNDEPRAYRDRSSGFGNIWLGGKWNLLSEYRDHPIALALRAFIKLPSADNKSGLGTGAVSGGGHVVVSKSFSDLIDSSYYVGFKGNGSGDLPFKIGNAAEWGMGAGFPRSSPLQGTVELTGSVYLGEDLMYRGVEVIGQPNPVDLLLGLNIHLANGLFLSGAWRTNLNYSVSGSTASGFNFRFGYHPGIHSK